MRIMIENIAQATATSIARMTDLSGPIDHASAVRFEGGGV
jgi:hypothetical protein